jgi:hypothetical protein
MRRKLKNSNNAVSEILGTVLLLGMAVSLFSLLSYVVLSYPFTPSAPSVNLVGTIDGSDVVLEHYGGESLDISNKVIITKGESISKVNISEYLIDSNNNELWDIGEQLVYFVGDVTEEIIDVTVVDISSNSIIMSGIIQEEISTTNGE